MGKSIFTILLLIVALLVVSKVKSFTYNNRLPVNPEEGLLRELNQNVVTDEIDYFATTTSREFATSTINSSSTKRE